MPTVRLHAAKQGDTTISDPEYASVGDSSISIDNQVGVQTGQILSDRIRIRIRKLNTDIRYPNIRADTDTNMVLNFNYPYPNSRYISYSLIYIMKKFMLFTIIIR